MGYQKMTKAKKDTKPKAVKKAKKSINKKHSGIEASITDEHRELVVSNISNGGRLEDVLKALQKADLQIASEITLAKYFSKEIDKGTKILHRLLKHSIYRRAFVSDALAIFIAKTKFKWSERSKFKADVSLSPDEQLKAYETLAQTGKLSPADAVRMAQLVEIKAKADKGNLGEVMPTVVVTPYTEPDQPEGENKDE